jgi:membrane protein required for colicin V production
MMSVVDIILLAVGLFFVVRGLMRGFAGEIISLCGITGGFVCSIRFYGPFEAILIEKLGTSVVVSTILSMLAIFFAIFFSCAFLEVCVKKVISKTNLTVTDKFLGATMGLIKMYIVTLLVFIGGVTVSPMTGDEWMKDSQVLFVSGVTWPLVRPLLEHVGMLPNIESIQNEARDYVMRQAGKTLLGASEDIALPKFGAVLSGDETEASTDIEP